MHSFQPILLFQGHKSAEKKAYLLFSFLLQERLDDSQHTVYVPRLPQEMDVSDSGWKRVLEAVD